MSIRETSITPAAEVDINDFHVVIVGKDPNVALDLLKQVGLKLPKKPFDDFENGWDQYLLVTGQNMACILTIGKLSFNEALRNGKNITIQCRGVFSDISAARTKFENMRKEEARHGID